MRKVKCAPRVTCGPGSAARIAYRGGRKFLSFFLKTALLPLPGRETRWTWACGPGQIAQASSVNAAPVRRVQFPSAFAKRGSGGGCATDRIRARRWLCVRGAAGGELEAVLAKLGPPDGTAASGRATGSPHELMVWLENGDDAAVVRMPGDTALILTTDFFTPVVDDAYDRARIAAANALSNVYAHGRAPGGGRQPPGLAA